MGEVGVLCHVWCLCSYFFSFPKNNCPNCKFLGCWIGHCLDSAIFGARGMCMFVYLYLLSDTLDFSKSTEIRYIGFSNYSLGSLLSITDAMLSCLRYVYS